MSGTCLSKAWARPASVAVTAEAYRQFDYQTINDVIVSISYTSEQDGALRAQVEAQNAAFEGSLMNFFSSTPARRLFSLRKDFSSAFTRTARSAAGTQVQIEIGDRNLGPRNS